MYKVQHKFFTCISGLMLFPIFLCAQNFTIQINAGNATYPNAIIYLDLPGADAREYQAGHLNRPLSTTSVQRLVSGKYMMVVPDTLLPGTIHYYRITPIQPDSIRSIFNVEETKNNIKVFVENRPVLAYQKATLYPGNDSASIYAGSGFIHPLYSPEGEEITDGFPAGHAHQNGIFSAWTSTTFKGDKVDFWNRHQLTGRTAHDEVFAIHVGSTAVQLETNNSFISLKHGRVFSENRVTTVYPFNQYFLFDVEIEQKNITDDTLFLNEYHYGGMALRGNKAWNPEDKEHFVQDWQLITNTGYKDTSANNTHATWVAAWGRVNQQVAGVCVFSHKDNFRHPQAIRVHPKMPYFTFAPCIDGSFFIAPGDTYKAQYRYMAFNGMPELEKLASLNMMFQVPPTVHVSLY